MKNVNIVDMRSQLASLLTFVSKGGEVLVHKRNIPVAKIVPVPTQGGNRTKLDCGKGSLLHAEDLTAPFLPADAWEMQK